MLIDDMATGPGLALSCGGNLVNLTADEIEAVIRADNVAELAQNDPRPIGEMPCLRPPFTVMWIEWTRGGARFGCYWKHIDSARSCYLNAYSWRTGSLRDEGHLFLVLRDDGTLQRMVGLEEECEWASEWTHDPERAREINWLAQRPLSPAGREIHRIAALTICLMHCKNVSAVERVPPPALQKARQKRGKRPLFRYHVLNIEPMAKVLRKEGGLGSGNGIAQALHICRGHFKDYRASGLFGKVKGIFWWDHHVRGDREKGVVIKDYEIGRHLAELR